MTLLGQITGSRGGDGRVESWSGGGDLQRFGGRESDRSNTRNLNFPLSEAKTSEILWPSLLFIHVGSTFECEYMGV